MGKDIVGSIRKVTLDGVTYDALHDSNVSEPGGPWQNESVATSGRNLRKMSRRSEERDGLILACNGAEREQLEELVGRTDDFTMSYQTASGDVYRCSGWVEFEKRETEEGRATVKLCPRDRWESFLA